MWIFCCSTCTYAGVYNFQAHKRGRCSNTSAHGRKHHTYRHTSSTSWSEGLIRHSWKGKCHSILKWIISHSSLHSFFVFLFKLAFYAHYMCFYGKLQHLIETLWSEIIAQRTISSLPRPMCSEHFSFSFYNAILHPQEHASLKEDNHNLIIYHYGEQSTGHLGFTYATCCYKQIS